MNRCPAAIIIRESRDLRNQIRAEYRRMVRDPAYQWFAARAHRKQSSQDGEAAYVARRLAELRKWSPGAVIV